MQPETPDLPIVDAAYAGGMPGFLTIALVQQRERGNNRTGAQPDAERDRIALAAASETLKERGRDACDYKRCQREQQRREVELQQR
jgi:hypothetical protein